MADTLEIFGTEYTGVTGIIATTPNETDLTYIRPQGTKSISANGTGIDVAEYASVNVNVPSGQPNLQSKIKTYTPTESAQTETVSADSGYDGLYEVSVSVGAISSTYVGTGITRRSATDMSGAYDKDIGNYQVSAPAGYYSSEALFTMPNGTIDTPTATKGTVSNHSVSITPGVFHTTGYIHGGIEEGTAVTVTASELASGNKSITENGTDIDVVGYSTVSVNVPSGSPTIQSLSIAPTTSQQTFNASGVDGYKPVTVAAVPTMTLPTSAASSATSDYTSKATIGRSTAAQYINIPPGYNSAGAYYVISAVANGSATAPASISGTAASVSTGTNTLTLTKTVSVTPTVSAGYVSSGTAGNSSISLTASVTTKAAATITPTTSNQTIASGTYLTGTQTISGDANLVAGNIKKDVSIFGVTGSYEGSGSGGSSDVQVDTIDASANTTTTLTFTGLSGEPTSFVIGYDGDIVTGTPSKVAAIVYDGTNTIGQTITNTSNAQVSYNNSSFSHSYSNGTLTVTSSGANFAGSEYVLTYSYGGTVGNIQTQDVQVGSGATSITFTGLDDEPVYWSCIFKSNFSTSSGYQRVIWVEYNSNDVWGADMDSSAHGASNWNYTYNNGSLTITSKGTNQGGYFHQPGYYQLTYAVGGLGGNYQTKSATYYATSSQQTASIAADSGYDALKKVNITIAPVTTTNLIANNIVSGVTVQVGDAVDSDRIASVTGNVVLQNYYTGSSAPSSSLGSNGDLYLQS